MKRINRCNEVVKLLSAARCCAKAVVDVAAVEFRFSAVKFVEKLLFDEADKKVSITRGYRFERNCVLRRWESETLK